MPRSTQTESLFQDGAHGMSDPEARLIKNYLNVCKKFNIESGEWDWEFLVRDRYVNGEITLADLPDAFKKAEAEYEKAVVKEEAETESFLIDKVIPIAVLGVMFFGVATVVLLVWPPN